MYFNVNLLRGLFPALSILILAGMAQNASAGLNLASTPDDGSGSLLLEFEFPAIERHQEDIDGLIFDHLLMEDAMLVGEAGTPELPVVSRLLQLPDRSDVQVEIVSMDTERLQGVYPWPSQERMHTELELPLEWSLNEELYGADAFYPATRLELGEPALMRNTRVCRLSVHPVQVNPQSGEAIVLKSLTLRVSYEGENLVNAREWDMQDPTPVLGTAIRKQVIAHPAAMEHGALSMDPLLDPGRLPGHYIVFAKVAALAQTPLQDYLDWKRRRGHKVTVVDETEVSFSTTAIRSRIIAEYQSDDPVDYVLLVGDTDGSYALPADGTSYDHYYAKLEGNDILGDVAVGRLSVDNATQLATVCNKIRSYESDPFTADDSWLNRAGLTVGSSVCAISMKILSRSIAAELVERRGYTDIDSAFCSGSSHVDDWFIEGLSFYSYRGWIGMEGLSCSSVQNLAQGPRTPVATIFTCSTGDFNGQDDYTECFLRGGTPSTPGAAVAAMGFATASTHTRHNNVVVGGYYHALLEYDIPEIGPCLLQGKYELYVNLPQSEQNVASNFANWGNLMGDPGTTQWAGSLPVPDIDVFEANINSGQNHVSYTISSDDEPIANAAVCVMQISDGTETMHEVTLTDANGMVTLPLSNLQAGELLVTVTHHRYRPLLLSVTVDGDAQWNPSVVGFDLDEDMLHPGMADQSLSVDLSNLGSEAMSALTISYDLDPAHGTVNAVDQNLATLDAGTDIVLDAIQVSSASDLTDGDLVPLQVSISSDQGDFNQMAWLPVSAPLPTVAGITTPDGELVPGMTGTISLTVDNMGSRDAEALLVSLSSATPFYAQVASPPQNGGTVAPGSDVDLEFDILVSELTMVGFPLLLDLQWSTSDGATGSTQVSVVVGTPSAGDPSGPDGYGYWAYENDDTTYDLAPTFDWVEITGAEGGPGTDLNLQDNGEEQEDAEWVDLPFDFTFYGETYDRMMVCSNGFVSFAENGFGEYNFRNHYFPSGMGPDAMIAPMWDDHMTTGAASVWVYHDEVDHRYIVTWWAMPAFNTGGPNTFQLILYDPLFHPTMTGDGSFMFQYLDFIDNQSEWTDFDHCSIGMKDHTSTIGMTLLNFTMYHPTMHTVTDNTAIFFTTSAGSNLAPPSLELSETQFEVALTSGEAGADSIMVRNMGELPLMWAMSLAEEERDSGGPDDFGYVWYDNTEDEGPDYSWLDYEDKTGVSFTDHDALSDWIDLDFVVYLYGEAFDRFRISPNGYVVFHTGEGTSANIELPSEDAPAYMVAAWWDDLKPSTEVPDQVWYWTDGEDQLVVSWDDVPHYNPFIHGGPIKAQFSLRSGGELTIQVASTGGGIYPDNTSGTVGVQGEAGMEGLSFFHNEDASAHLPWAVRMTPPAWVMTYGPESGSVAPGDSTWIGLQFTSVPGFPLPDGDYSAEVLLFCNDLDNLQTVLPVIMNVSGNDVAAGTLPVSTELNGAWPNPFNPSTQIEFSLAQARPVNLSIYNLRGQLVSRLLESHDLAAGSHAYTWNAAGAASGLYIVVLEAGATRDEMKLMLLK